MLYVHLMSREKDAIYRKFEKYLLDDNIYQDMDLKHIKLMTRTSEVKKSLMNDSITLQQYIDKYNVCNIPKNKLSTKKIIDFNHYIIRYHMMLYRFWYNISLTPQHKVDTIMQMYATLMNLKGKELEGLFRNKYHKKKCEYYFANKIEDSNKIPILRYCSENIMYSEYYKHIKDTYKNIISKIRILDYNTLPVLCPVEIVLLYHILNLEKRNHLTAHITISDVYNIIHIYKQNIHTDLYFHYDCDCICHKIFLTNDSVLNDIDYNLTAYYSNITKIDIICNNIINRINLNNCAITILHNVYTTEDENIVVCNNIDMVAWDDDNVYIFYISPQFNKMNSKEKIIDCVLNTYLFTNVGISKTNTYEKNNIKKFSKKNIHNIVVTLDSDTPIMIDLTNINELNVNKIIYEYCLQKYSKYNNDIITLIKFNIEKNNNNINSLYDILIKTVSLLDDNNKGTHIHSPIYIKESIVRIRDEIDDTDKQNIEKYTENDYYEIRNILAKKMNRVLKKYFRIP